MDFDINWDVEKYKSPFESDEHWELRRNFLLAHKDKYPEERLVCLAQVFFNVEFLGCKYPKKTMDLVSELSEGIADSFREKKQQKIQRTFVKASDAAGARLKGLSQSNPSLSSNIDTVDAIPKEIKTVEQPNSNANNKTNASTDSSNEISSVFVANFRDIFPQCNPFKNLIIIKTLEENFFESGTVILNRSCAKKKINLQFSYNAEETNMQQIWKCKITICGKIVSSATATTKLNSKKAAAEVLLNSLQDICFTLEEKQKVLSDGSKVDRDLDQVVPTESKLSDNNIGSKMMKMMGWKGGGLGKTEQGRSEPVTVQDHVRRSGLGVKLTQHELMKKLHNKLKTFAKMETNYDLVFSSDFSKDERAELHSIARKFHLKTRSYGTGEDRYVVVSKHASQESIIQALIKCGGENERYRLISPLKMEF